MDINIVIIASFLLAIRIAILPFLFSVAKTQLALFKKRAPKRVVFLRKVLFYMTLLGFIGQFVPITIDVLTILNITWSPLIFIYAISNALTALLMVVGYWLIYRVAKKVDK